MHVLITKHSEFEKGKVHFFEHDAKGRKVVFEQLGIEVPQHQVKQRLAEAERRSASLAPSRSSVIGSMAPT